MQLSSSQQRILADMGIQPWVLRRAESLRSEKSQTTASVKSETAVISMAAQTVLLLVMEHTRLSEAGRRLLNAMLKATSLSPEQVMTLSADDFKQIDSALLANKAVLLMGTQVTAQLLPELTPGHPETVNHYQADFSACFSLDEMLHQPPLKASAWRALQQLRNVF